MGYRLGHRLPYGDDSQWSGSTAEDVAVAYGDGQTAEVRVCKELVGNLSEAFRQGRPAIPWRQIKLMLNIVAHRYGTVDHTITWDVVEHDIPVLRAYCGEVLAQGATD